MMNMSNGFDFRAKTKVGLTAALTCFLLSGPAFAQDVVLSANDGSVDVQGELISFDDGFYTIRTPIGEMRMSAARVSCVGVACPVLETEEADFMIAGSDTVGDELLPLLLEGYGGSLGAETDLHTTSDKDIKIATLIGEQGYGDQIAQILIEARGSSTAFQELLAGRAEVGMASRRIRPKEARALRASGGGSMIHVDQERVIAVDSLLILVSPDNPIDVLSIDQISQIYAGEIVNWSELGGANLPINIYARGEDSGTRGVFEARTLDPRSLSISTNVNIVASNIDMSRNVVEDAGGIGYTPFSFRRGAKSIDIITECGIRTRADAFAAKTEEYPFQRRLYLYNKAEGTSEGAQNFLDYTVSDKADNLVAKAGFIDLGVTRHTQDAVVERITVAMNDVTEQFELDLMKEVARSAEDWERLSTTFRFASGSSQLDNKALRDLDRLVQYLEAQPRGTEVALVGFTDSNGPEEANHEVAISRAADVMIAVKEFSGERLGGVEFSSMGFGELSPAACNTTANGRSINRRVEVWIR